MITRLKEYKCKEHVEMMEIDGEWVVFNAENCMVTKLNEMGGYIWSNLQKHTDVREIIQSIQEQYDIDSERAENDIYLFIHHLREIGLLEFCESGE